MPKVYMGLFCMNDEKPIDHQCAQFVTMRQSISYPCSTHKMQKNIITYFKANGIMAMMKHVYPEHFMLAHKLFEKVNCNTRDPHI